MNRRKALGMLIGGPVAMSLVGCGRAPDGAVEAAASTSPAAPTAATPCVEPRACLQPVVNVHDWVHIEESAETLLRCVDLYEKYKVRGDFYLTGPMVRCYLESRPDVLERLRASRQGISYHVRPPHPLYDGFGQRFRGMSDSDLRAALLDYETYGLDLGTGELLRSEAGGYRLVADALGRAPVVVGAPTSDGRIKAAAIEVYKELGAKMVIAFHETGTKPERPFEYRQGLLARPSDFSVTRWTADGVGSADNEQFWWNMMDSPHEAAFKPAGYLRTQIAGWQHDRPALVTALIHENNFVRSGAESWTYMYSDRDKQPLPGPWDLSPDNDRSKIRTAAQQEAIWAAYEELVAYGASELAVVSSEDVLALAEASGADGWFAPVCETLGRVQEG